MPSAWRKASNPVQKEPIVLRERGVPLPAPIANQGRLRMMLASIARSLRVNVLAAVFFLSPPSASKWLQTGASREPHVANRQLCECRYPGSASCGPAESCPRCGGFYFVKSDYRHRKNQLFGPIPNGSKAQFWYCSSFERFPKRSTGRSGVPDPITVRSPSCAGTARRLPKV